MTGIEAIAAIATDAAPGAPALTTQAALRGPDAFAHLLMNGVAAVDQQVTAAQDLSARFAVDGSVPPHQVTLALEEARLSVELMLQVRTHLVDGFNELMRMQL